MIYINFRTIDISQKGFIAWEKKTVSIKVVIDKSCWYEICIKSGPLSPATAFIQRLQVSDLPIAVAF